MSSDPTSGGMPTPPIIKSGKEVYAEIMGKIEPDLVLSEEELNTKYNDETPEENEQRMERYRNAFIKYMKQYEEYRKQRQAEVQGYKKDVFASVEGRDQAREDAAMNDLESAISNA